MRRVESVGTPSQAWRGVADVAALQREPWIREAHDMQGRIESIVACVDAAVQIALVKHPGSLSWWYYAQDNLPPNEEEGFHLALYQTDGDNEVLIFPFAEESHRVANVPSRSDLRKWAGNRHHPRHRPVPVCSHIKNRHCMPHTLIDVYGGLAEPPNKRRRGRK